MNFKEWYLTNELFGINLFGSKQPEEQRTAKFNWQPGAVWQSHKDIQAETVEEIQKKRKNLSREAMLQGHDSGAIASYVNSYHTSLDWHTIQMVKRMVDGEVSKFKMTPSKESFSVLPYNQGKLVTYMVRDKEPLRGDLFSYKTTWIDNSFDEVAVKQQLKAMPWSKMYNYGRERTPKKDPNLIVKQTPQAGRPVHHAGGTRYGYPKNDPLGIAGMNLPKNPKGEIVLSKMSNAQLLDFYRAIRSHPDPQGQKIAQQVIDYYQRRNPPLSRDQQIQAKKTNPNRDFWGVANLNLPRNEKGQVDMSKMNTAQLKSFYTHMSQHPYGKELANRIQNYLVKRIDQGRHLGG